jgi:hypothetical protein
VAAAVYLARFRRPVADLFTSAAHIAGAEGAAL